MGAFSPSDWFSHPVHLNDIKGASENRRLFDRKIRLLELDDFGDSNANWNANGRKKCAVSET